MLTWEFPPYIAGGLGMACYGFAKSLLSMGVEIDLVLPTAEEVYFPLRRPEDADILPIAELDPSRKSRFTTQTMEDLEERLKIIGVSAIPESYITPGFSLKTFHDYILHKFTTSNIGQIGTMSANLRGDEPIFKKVQELAVRSAKYLSTFNFDVIHAHDWLTYPAALILKEMTGKKLVSHIHATEFDRAGGPGDGRIHNIEYTGLSSADLVVAVSRYTARMIIDRYRIEPGKIEIVHNAYSLSNNLPLEKKKLFKDPLILFLGRVTLQKGPDYFLNVAEKVLRRHPKVRFVLAGTGDMFSRILKTSASKRLRDRFLLTGFLNRRQVEQILSATDIFVLPSVSEPFGIVPLEAMAFGAVAILSKQSGVAEVVKNVYKVDFWDIDKTVEIITNLLGNPDEMIRTAKAGQDEVFAIGWQKAAKKLLRIYEGLTCST